MNGSNSFLLFAAIGGSDFNLSWCIFAVLTVIVFLVACFAYHHYRKVQANSHYALFRGLCRVHGLDSNSKRLLSNIAQYYNIDKPVRLLIDPSWLDQAQSENVFSADAELIDDLLVKLFG